MERAVRLDELMSFTASFPEPIVFNWQVLPETFVKSGMQLGTFLSSEQEILITSHISGIIKNLPKNSHDIAPIVITECKHETSFGEICTDCGEATKEMKKRSYRGLDDKISYSKARAIKEEKKYIDDLYKSKKLMLVLDIDNTLVHTCTGECADPAIATEGERFTDELGYTFIVKFRPLLSTFLDIVGRLFDVYLYSHGSQRYAEAISKLIDPEQKTIKRSKVLGRETNSVICKFKTLKNLLPTDQRISIIVDDRIDVWKNKENVIRIYPYVYFNSEIISYDRTMYPTLTYRSQDCSLLYFSNLLRNLHSLFYDMQDKYDKIADIRTIIKTVRSHILHKIKVYFKTSSEFKTDEEQKIATSMGAVIISSIEDHTIILVNQHENDIIQKEKSKGLRMVDINWLILSDRYWWKLPLEYFEVSKENPIIKLNEVELANQMQKNLKDNTYWKYDYYNDILQDIIDSFTIENDVGYKRKKFNE